MGVNTKGIITKQVEATRLVKILKQKFDVVATVEKNSEDYSTVVFNYKNEDRRLSVFKKYDVQGYVEGAGKGQGTLIDLNYWGNSVKIIKGIVEEFGGYMVDDDCNGDWKVVKKR